MTFNLQRVARMKTDLTSRGEPCKIIPRRRVLLENLIVTQIVKNLPTFYGTQSFVTVLKTALQLFLSGARYGGVTKSFRTDCLERKLPLGAVVSIFCESI